MLKRIAFTLLFFLVLGRFALADAGCEITVYSLEITVFENGDAQAAESLICRIDGEYGGGLLWGDGTPVQADNSVHANGEARLFTREYRLPGLARRYTDTGMILKEFIGANGAVPLKNAVITVRLPGEDADGIRAFAHGGMGEKDISIQGGIITFGPADILPGQGAEIRLLFPEQWIKDAPSTGQDALAAALAEEARLSRDALAEEARLSRDAQAWEKGLSRAKYAYAAGYVLLLSSLTLRFVRKYRFKGAQGEQSDPARLTRWPAAFAVLALNGTADANALGGTLAELAKGGRIALREEGDKLRLEVKDTQADGLFPHQVHVLRWLFDHRSDLPLSSLRAGDDPQRAQAFETGYARYTALVREDMAARGLVYQNEGARILINVLAVLPGIGGAAFALMAGPADIVLGIVMTVLPFLFIFLTGQTRSLSDDGERLRLSAKALKEAPRGPEGQTNLFPWYVALGMGDAPFVPFPGDSDKMEAALWLRQAGRVVGELNEAHMRNASLPKSAPR